MHPAVTILIATLCATILSISIAGAILIFLRICGIRTFFPVKRRVKKRTKTGEAQHTELSGAEGELPEDELLVILSAAAMATLNDNGTSRFRVVAFRRI